MAELCTATSLFADPGTGRHDEVRDRVGQVPQMTHPDLLVESLVRYWAGLAERT